MVEEREKSGKYPAILDGFLPGHGANPYYLNRAKIYCHAFAW